MGQAPKICGEPGCPNLSPCPAHSKAPWAGSRRRDQLRTRSGSREQKINRTVMHVHGGICHVCEKPGADEVDHVIPVSEGGPDTFENRRPIHSDPCHKNKTQEEAQRARRQ